jgi:hypothetical protein
MKVEASVDGKLYLGCRKCQGVTEKVSVHCLPETRIRRGNAAARASGDYVLYSMIAGKLRYNFAAHGKDYDQYRSLPAWAQETLKRHTKDERELVYHLETLETARAMPFGMRCRLNRCAKEKSIMT